MLLYVGIDSTDCLCLMMLCSFELSKSPATVGNVTHPDKKSTISSRISNSESDQLKANGDRTEDGQPKSNDDTKIMVNLDRLEVTLSRKETPIVKAVIEG